MPPLDEAEDLRVLWEMHQEIRSFILDDPALIERARSLIGEATAGSDYAERWWRKELARVDEYNRFNVLGKRAGELLRRSPVIAALDPAQRKRLFAAAQEKVEREERERREKRHSRTKPESRLAQLRIERGLSQEQMVERTGLPESTYWRLERKKITNPPIGYLTACARALGCPLEELLEQEWLDWRPRQGGK